MICYSCKMETERYKVQIINEGVVASYKKWLEEDWEFEITVINGEAEQCRMGLEKGDKFYCKYECPSGFCPKTMALLHTYCEIARCRGDYRLRGSKASNEIDFPCADNCIEFHLVAKHIDTE
ncbi:MAG: TIGR04076 family protein [Clostridiaceae bacterium]